MRERFWHGAAGQAHLVSLWWATLPSMPGVVPGVNLEFPMAQAILDFPAQPVDDGVAFELGRDFARHALTPPLERLPAGSPLRRGWVAGRASFGARTLVPTPPVRQWLQLRLDAWRCGVAFEAMLVTPNYLRQIDVAWCPVTRRALTRHTGGMSDASIARVRDDAGYAAGNLAVISAQAHAAKGRCDFDGALALMRLAEAVPAPTAGESVRPELDGLGAAEWARVAVLCSLVTALPHEQAASLPLLLLPPNRLRMLNPVQALQALLTRQFGLEGLSARLTRIEALLPGSAPQRDFRLFVNALLPRVLERGHHADAQAMRWTLEDAWRDPLVLRCWSRLARQLTAAQAERIVLRANVPSLDGQRAQPLTTDQATEGWELERHGDSLAAVGRRASPAPARRRQSCPPASIPRSAPLQLAFGA